jgi:hypothetical protein
MNNNRFQDTVYEEQENAIVDLTQEVISQKDEMIIVLKELAKIQSLLISKLLQENDDLNDVVDEFTTFTDEESL